MLEKEDGVVWPGFMRLRLGTIGGGFLKLK
jgi:hypothetical protein